MLSESLEHTLGALMMESYVILGVDSHVIHVDLKPLLQKHICEDMVHESLEGGGSVAEPKEHDSGFKESHGGDESGLPLIFLSDANVVISPMNVKFGEQGGSSGSGSLGRDIGFHPSWGRRRKERLGGISRVQSVLF